MTRERIAQIKEEMYTAKYFEKNARAGSPCVITIDDAMKIVKDHSDEEFSLQDYVKKFLEWNKRSFGDHHGTGYRNILGMTEEAGELMECDDKVGGALLYFLGKLSHAHLKREQDIRKNEDHEKRKKDAIGDLLNFLIAYCDSQGFTLEECLLLAWGEIKDRTFSHISYEWAI